MNACSISGSEEFQVLSQSTTKSYKELVLVSFNGERLTRTYPVATSAHCTDRFYIHPSLKSSSHIFLRVDRVQPPLRQPYTGPHKVLCRTDKTITVDINGRKTTVSLDRVKPAHLLPETVLSPPPVIKNLKSTDVHTSKNDEPPTYVTRSERRVHFPKKLTTYIT
ncbi:hypothetical protein AVEN_26155-1 [Araneus ventricosus]|uniref:Uncharacterized protein n=1 Tax=Araneus ventricosus TaxID=182803 RepID=A0A4Y2EQF8_ARAVE|nr:hypothetical protein AVEN_26155-1 [Araneus ventricosus]